MVERHRSKLRRRINELEQENADLRERVGELEGALERLKTALSDEAWESFHSRVGVDRFVKSVVEGTHPDYPASPLKQENQQGEKLEWLAKIAKRFVRNHREGGISFGYEYLASAVDALDVEEVSNDELRAARAKAKLEKQGDI